MTGTNENLRDNLVYAFLILASAFLLHAPHLLSYVGDVNYDFFLHYNWAKEFSENFLAGDMYPRWIFHGRYGLGEPVFITYSPVYYYLVALFASLGFDNWVSMQLVAIFCNAAFACFVYAAAKRYVSNGMAAFIAIAALLNPFLVMLHYKFHGLAWGAASYFSHGMLFWALTRPEAKRRGLNAWAAVAIGLAVGTHIISALVNLICYSAYCVARSFRSMGEERQPFSAALMSWTITVAVGLLLSGAYLYPALYYLKVMNAETWVGDYRLEAFAWPVVTLLTRPTQWFSIQWPISVPALLMFVLAGSYYLRFRKTLGVLSSPLLLVLSASAMSVFFASELSYPIWIFPNPISQINLPYRFVSVTYTTAIFAAGLTLYNAHSVNRRKWLSLLAISLGLSVLFAVGALFKGAYLDGKPLGREVEQGDYTFGVARERFAREGYLTRCAQESSQCIRALRSAGGFSGVPEYELKWAKPAYVKYAHSGYLAYCKKLAVSCKSPKRIESGMDFEIDTEKAVEIILPIFYYPAWLISVGDKTFPSEPDPETGLIRVNVESGSHKIAVRWIPTDVERHGLLATLVGVGILLLYCVGSIASLRYLHKLKLLRSS